MDGNMWNVENTLLQVHTIFFLFFFFFIHSWFSALNKKEAGMILFSIVGISHSDIKRNMKKN